MKFFVAFFVAIALFQVVFSDTDAEKKKFYSKCLSESSADAGKVTKLRAGDYSEDSPELESFVYCMLSGAGYINAAGDFQKDVALSKYIKDDKAEVEAAINACDGTSGSSPQNKAFNMAKCYSTKRPGKSVV